MPDVSCSLSFHRSSARLRKTRRRRWRSCWDMANIPTSSPWRMWVTSHAPHVERQPLSEAKTGLFSGVWWRALGVLGDWADERRWAAGQNPTPEVLLGERSQRRPLHHHKDCRVPACAGGTSLTLCSYSSNVPQGWPLLTACVVATGGAQRPEAQQHPVCGRERERRVHQDLWLWFLQTAESGERSAHDAVLHC